MHQKTDAGKYCTPVRFFMKSWHSGYNCFVVHRLCKNRLTSFVGAGIRAFGAAMHVHILLEAAVMSLNHAG